MNLLNAGHRDSDKVDRDHEHISIDVFANNPVGAAVDPPTDDCTAPTPQHRCHKCNPQTEALEPTFDVRPAAVCI